MESSQRIRCRVAACQEGRKWNFHLINDSPTALDFAVLHKVGYEWGDFGNAEEVDVRVTDLTPGGHALIWRDDGSGAETRMDLFLRVQMSGREVLLSFEFPKLYCQRNLRMIEGLGKFGWEEAAEG